MNYTQFHLPDGKRTRETAKLSEEQEKKAEELKAAGWKFEMEVLSTGHISVDCCANEDQLWMVLGSPDKLTTCLGVVADKAHAEWIRRDKPRVNK